MASIPPPTNQPVPAKLPVIHNDDIKTDSQDPTKHQVTVSYNNKSYKVTVFGGQNRDQIKDFALELIALAVAYNVGGKNKKLTVSKGYDQQGNEQMSVDRNRTAADGTPKSIDSGKTTREIIHVKQARIDAKLVGATDPAHQQLSDKLKDHITKGLEIFDSIYPPPATRVRATPILDQDGEENAGDREAFEATLIPSQRGDSHSSPTSRITIAELKQTMQQANLPALTAMQEEVLEKLYKSQSAGRDLSDEQVRAIEGLATPLMMQTNISLQRLGTDIFFVRIRNRLDRTNLSSEVQNDVEKAFEAYIKKIPFQKDANVLQTLIEATNNHPNNPAFQDLAVDARTYLASTTPIQPLKIASLENRNDLGNEFEAEIHPQ